MDSHGQFLFNYLIGGFPVTMRANIVRRTYFHETAEVTFYHYTTVIESFAGNLPTLKRALHLTQIH